MKRGLAVVGAVALVALLTGCEQSGLGPVALSRDGKDLLLAVCDTVEVSGVQGQFQAVGSNSWADLVDLEGDVTLTSGTILNLNHAIEGFDGAPNTVDAAIVGVVVLTFLGKDNFGADFVDTSKLKADAWLQTNGDETAVPCPAQPST